VLASLKETKAAISDGATLDVLAATQPFPLGWEHENVGPYYPDPKGKP
jgi:hypothetical protein